MTQPQRPLVRASDIVAGLRQLGVGAGDTLMAHSSLSALGWVCGGADAVIDAALAAVGPTGTVAMPTLCQSAGERRFAVWNPATSPSDVGRITDTFWRRPAALRSDHATHSVAAMGPQAAAITGGHRQAHGRPSPWGPAAFGHGCPWDVLYSLNAWYVFLGVNFRVNTTRHYIQCLLVESVLAAVPACQRPDLEAPLRGWQRDGVWPSYDDERMEQLLTGEGLVHRAIIGHASCRSIRTRDLVDRSLALLRADPASWFPSDFVEWLRHAQSRAALS